MAINTLERLKIELNEKPYYDDPTYEVYLEENDLDPTDTYDKSTMQKQFYQTVYDILSSLSNNIDLFRDIETEFATTGEAYSALEKRLKALEKRIESIPDSNDSDDNSSIHYLFCTR